MPCDSDGPASPAVAADSLLALVGGSTKRDKRGSKITFGPRWGDPCPVARTEDGGAYALVELPPGFWADIDEHPLHPAILDCVLGTAQPDPTQRLP